MKFSTSAAILALATVVAAAPGYHPPTPGGSVSAEQFVNSCGRNNVECCNKEVERKEVNPTNNGGLLNALNGIGLDSLSVFDQCSKLDIPINVIGASVADLLNKQCASKVACCGNNGKAFNGLLNVDAGCAVPNLI